MVFLKLLGYALGSVVMYWGVVLLLVAPWVLGLILIVLGNALWNKITGQQKEWKWLLNGLDAAAEKVESLKAEWVGWIPGIVIQVWYAGYAADLVQGTTLTASMERAIAIHLTGFLGIVLAATVFYWLYNQVIDVNFGLWVYVLLGGVALIAYGIFLQQPQTAAVLGESWKQVFSVVLSEFIQSF